MKQFALSIYHSIVPPRIDREIQRALSLPQPRFPNAVSLPPRFGKGMTERVVEIFIARLTYSPGKEILDVGHANILGAHKRMLKSLSRPLNITGIDLVVPTDEIRELYARSVVGNIAETSFADGSFDIIWCISALEHFGMDNSMYASDFPIDTEMDKKALLEMMRIAKVDGTIYISVPYGKYEDHGWLRNYDVSRWQELLSSVRASADIHELYFKYSDTDGWQVATPPELAQTGYFDHQNSGASGLAVALIRKTH